jgi:hypothetical protein
VQVGGTELTSENLFLTFWIDIIDPDNGQIIEGMKQSPA